MLKIGYMWTVVQNSVTLWLHCGHIVMRNNFLTLCIQYIKNDVRIYRTITFADYNDDIL